MSNKRVLAVLFCLLSAPAFANWLAGPLTVTAGSNPRGLASADLDGDGIPEVIAANFGAGTLIGQTSTAITGSIQIFKANAGSLNLSQTLVTGSSPRSLAVLDLNGDGRPDLVASFYDDSSVGVYLQQANHQFSPFVATASGTHPVGIAAALVGSVPMVAVANYNSDSVSLYSSSGGSLQLQASLACGSNPTDVKFHSSSTGSELVIANFSANSISIYPLNPGGKPGTRQDIPVPGNPCKIAFGDLNGDGQDDMAVAQFSSNQIAVFYGNNGVFSGTPVEAALAGQHPNGLTIGKVTGSSQALLISADRDSDEIDVIKHAADGSFPVLTSLYVKDGSSTQFGPIEVLAVDLNGSGRNSIVTSQMRTGQLKIFNQMLPAVPLVSSPTHPDPAQYYASTDARFHFDSAADLDGIDHYVAAFDQVPSTVPTTNSKSFGPDTDFSGLDTGNYYIHVRAVDTAGDLGDVTHFKIGVTAALSQANTYNYPNPSRDGNTTIRFALLEPTAVTLRIYDEIGKLVWSKDLNAGDTIAGVNSVLWDGHNDRGQVVGNGGYILRLSGAGKTVIKKIAIVR